MSRTRPALAVMFGAALALSAAACGSTTPEENTASACAAYSEFTESVSQARESLDSSSTIEEIRAERDNMANKFNDLDAALEDVNADRRAALEDAWNTFDENVTNLDESMTVPEAVDSLSGELDQVRDARADLQSELGC